jgi:hypothetical protein
MCKADRGTLNIERSVFGVQRSAFNAQGWPTVAAGG